MSHYPLEKQSDSIPRWFLSRIQEWELSSVCSPILRSPTVPIVLPDCFPKQPLHRCSSKPSSDAILPQFGWFAVRRVRSRKPGSENSSYHQSRNFPDPVDLPDCCRMRRSSGLLRNCLWDIKCVVCRFDLILH